MKGSSATEFVLVSEAPALIPVVQCVSAVFGGITHVPSSLRYLVVVAAPGAGTRPATVLGKFGKSFVSWVSLVRLFSSQSFTQSFQDPEYPL